MTMHALTLFSVLLLSPLAALRAAGKPAQYEATWSSLDVRPTPAWYSAAKFGIFIHWGVYAVPAFAAAGLATLNLVGVGVTDSSVALSGRDSGDRSAPETSRYKYTPSFTILTIRSRFHRLYNALAT